MRKDFWIIVFIAVLIAHLTGIWLDSSLLQIYSKPLLIPTLIAYLLSQTRNSASNLKKWVLFALLFSWVGDVLLMFVPTNDIYFLLGLAAFLLAHIFYILFFHFTRLKEQIKSNPWLLVVVVIYYALLINWLSPYLDDMKIPVRVYGVVISFMLMLAMHMIGISNKKAGQWMMIGALLFVISDSVLAINKFYKPFELAGVIIMLTYGLAQLFIVKGAVSYINSNRQLSD